MESFDRRRETLLAVAARVFAEHGYHRTSMRDLARVAKMSLAGMYYYVHGKEDLLFQIQKSCFDAVHQGALEAVNGHSSVEEKLAAFIRHHVTYFASHMAEMKVLSHEAESLTGPALEEVRGLKRAYVNLCQRLIAEVGAAAGGDAIDPHVAGYALFGMMNWIYTWYDPSGPIGAAELSDAMCRLFLNGYTAEVTLK